MPQTASRRAPWGALLALLLAPASALAVSPPFQAVGLFGDLAVVDSDRLLTVATQIAPDAGFSSVLFVTGLARHPASGDLFLAGNDFFQNSYLARVDFATGAVTSVGTIPGEFVVDLAFDGAGALYALTDNAQGLHPHALLRLDQTTAAATVVKVLDPHGGTSDFGQSGALAWNPADASLYYADRGASPPRLFVDRLTPGTFAQTTVLSATIAVSPLAMAFAGGRLWIATNFAFFSGEAANLAGGLVNEGLAEFPTPDGTWTYVPSGMVPADLDCTPSATVACLAHRFRVEVTYDALPQNGTGPGNVVLESTESVKFTFFNPANIELILKVLDACAPPFNKWWVFAGGLTDVGVRIKVTDTKTGAARTYTSAKGNLFEAFADTSAFDCP